MLWMRSARSSIRVSAFLALLVLAGASGLAQDVTGTFVPIVVPGATFTAARAITADGRVVGFSAMRQANTGSCSRTVTSQRSTFP